MNTKKIVAFITLVMFFSQSCYCQDAKLQNCDKNTQVNDTIIPSEEDYYDIPAKYSEFPKYNEEDEWAFYDCIWDNINFADIEVIRSAKMVTLTCMIDTEGNITAFKLLDFFTKKEIKEKDYSPFQKELVKALAKTKKWIPAHFLNVPIAFPIVLTFRIPSNFLDNL